MSVQKGVGIVWGISSEKMDTGTGKAVITSQTFGSESDEVEHRDETGKVVGITTFNNRETMEVTVYPSGATLLAGKNANILPKAGETVKIIDADDTDVGNVSPNGKTWHVVSSTKNRSNEDKVTFNMSLRRYAGITNYASIIA